MSINTNRRRMPRERGGLTVKFVIDGQKGYLTTGVYDDGTLGEIFLNGVGKDGSTLRGMMDAWATDFSIGLQHGVPLEVLVRKHAHVSFPPAGPTGDPDVPMATSIVDYVARKLAAIFLSTDSCEELGVLSSGVKQRMIERLDMQEQVHVVEVPSIQSMNGHVTTVVAVEATEASQLRLTVAPDLGTACRECGGMLQRTGTCHTCSQCGYNTGCG